MTYHKSDRGGDTDGILILWDIDGTLIQQYDRSTLFNRALEPWAPTEFLATWKPVSKGLPDSQILSAGLVESGFSQDEVKTILPSACRQLGICQQQEVHLIPEQSPILPGVRSTLFSNKLGGRPIVHSLATGNTFLRSFLKVRSHDLLENLSTFLGCYGDDATDRAVMVAAGLERISLWEKFNRARFTAIFIVGDSIHDVEAASQNELPSIGLTSSGESPEMLTSHGATRVVSSAHHVLTAIESYLVEVGL